MKTRTFNSRKIKVSFWADHTESSNHCILFQTTDIESTQKDRQDCEISSVSHLVLSYWILHVTASFSKSRVATTPLVFKRLLWVNRSSYRAEIWGIFTKLVTEHVGIFSLGSERGHKHALGDLTWTDPIAQNK